MYKNIESNIKELLHINEFNKNKLVDLNCAGNSYPTYYLKNDNYDLKQLVSILLDKYGKPGTILLRRSAVNVENEQLVASKGIVFDWLDQFGACDSYNLHKTINKIYTSLKGRGTNPLFLSLGSVEYKVAYNSDDAKTIKVPLIIFPIKLIRGTFTSPVCIELVAGGVFINPCLLYRLELDFSSDVSKKFPMLEKDINDYVEDGDVETITNYILTLNQFFVSISNDETNNAFKMDNSCLALSIYDHSDICMYYDILANYDKFTNNKLNLHIFENNKEDIKARPSAYPSLNILPSDSTQDEIIRKVKEGDSIIIKGPPGTGKTVTIVNIIANAILDGKTILVSSKKFAALSEVYAKMPANLRKFLLLLESESESNISKLKAKKLKTELSSVLHEVNSYTQPAKLKERDRVMREKSIALNEVDSYRKHLYESKTVLGDSLYDALCYQLSFKLTERLDRVSYKEPKLHFVKPISDFLIILKDINTLYKDITDDYNIHFEDNPFINSKEIEYDRLSSSFNRINHQINEIVDFYESLTDAQKAIFDYLKLDEITYLIKCKDKDLLRKVFETRLSDADIKKLEKAYKTIGLEDKEVELIASKDYEQAKKVIKLLIDQKKELLNVELKTANAFIYLFKIVNDNKLNFKGMDYINLGSKLSQYAKLLQDKEDHLYQSRSFFKDSLTDKELELVKHAVTSIEKYKDTDTKFYSFDVIGKMHFKKMKDLSFLDSYTFEEYRTALNHYKAIFEIQDSLRVLRNEISKTLHSAITDEGLDYLLGIKDLLTDADVIIESKMYNTVHELYDKLLELDGSFKDVTSLNFALKYAYGVVAFNDLKELLSSLYKVDNVDYLSLYRYSKTVNTLPQNIDIDSLLAVLNDSSKDVVVKAMDSINEILSDLSELGLNNFYTRKGVLMYKNLIIFSKYSTNPKYYSYCGKFYEKRFIIDKILNIEGIIAAYESKIKDKVTNNLYDCMLEALYRTSIDIYLKAIGDKRFLMTQEYNRSVKALKQYTEELQKLHCLQIENLAVQSIKASGETFDFLDYQNDHSSLRFLFKKHFDEIALLKKCLIASPSSISVLLKETDFTFDLALIDEASQMEPVNILPIAGRAKQIVVVGDEWQMPPIVHFRSKNKDDSQYDESGSKEASTSLLSLALHSSSFPSEEFRSHYRSRTESLIKFSQERYYQNMITFPAATPKAPGLGFTDIYIPNAPMIDGVNDLEAKEVVKCLNKHFETYFDGEKLRESVGVIAFGDDQLTQIQRYVDKDAALLGKINKAKSNLSEDQTEEKVIFFKTIEGAQGQETDHLILSLAYGVKEDGSIQQRFAELNTALGDRIFNVAVSRSRSSITVIHSIKASEIDANKANLSFLKEYLTLSEYFANESNTQFISRPEDNAFIADVKNYLLSLGIAEERLVVNYGVTKGSVRIPLVLLNEELNKALVGFWIEKPPYNNFNYIDYNVNFYDTLCNNGWNLVNINIIDWFTSKEETQNKLREIVSRR